MASLAADRLYSTIVRARAVAELGGYEREATASVFTAALDDEESLVRQTAVRRLPENDPLRRLKLLAPLLYDPVRAVRIEAAAALAGVPQKEISANTRRQFEKALAEYRQAMERTADFASSRHNLGNLYVNLGEDAEAEKHYLSAIAIDREFCPAKVNLAMLYSRQGRNGNAEKLLREVTENHPDFYEIKYSLGLLLAEENRFEEVVVLLGDAAAGLPQRSRIQYNLSLLLQKICRDDEAENALKKALAVEPNHPDYLYALTVSYMQRGRWNQARRAAEQMQMAHPDIPAVRELLNAIDQKAGQ